MSTTIDQLLAEIEQLPSRGRWHYDDDYGGLETPYGTDTLALLESPHIGPWIAASPKRLRGSLLLLSAITRRLAAIVAASSPEAAAQQAHGAISEIAAAGKLLGLSRAELVALARPIALAAVQRRAVLFAAPVADNENDTDAWTELNDTLDAITLPGEGVPTADGWDLLKLHDALPAEES
jgi:hypothetical protein